MFHTHVFLVLVAAAWVAAEQPAVASCLISNQTTYAFAIDSGSAANQRVGPHARTTIEAGKIKGTSPDGRTISGACKDGGDLLIHEQNGVPLLVARDRLKPGKADKKPKK